ncbi:MAG: diguanylate cyclase, partial [Burkholderiales bacterium]|nr:diguanylate cyclase [Phycisphaerae bacterium]
QRFRAIFDNVRDYAIYTVDSQGLVDDWNPSLERLGGWRAEDVKHRPLDMFFAEEERVAGQMQRLLERARVAGSVESEGWRRRRDNTSFWANTVITALPDEAGEIRGFVAVSRDMTERKRMEDELRRLATTDPLTGALNRRAGQVLLGNVFRSAHLGDRRPAVVMIDIDHFKAINDHHGHEAGDRALCALVTICQGVVGHRGSLVRWGGEEFLIILASTQTEEALTLAEELRVAIEAAETETRGGKIVMTASFGIAIGGANSENLIHRADTALYAAKIGGRNRVVLSV